MNQPIFFSVARLFALVAIAVHLAAPGAMALAKTRDGSIAGFFCGPAGTTLSAEAKAAAATFAKLIGRDPAPSKAPSWCPFCTLAHAAPTPEAPALAAPLSFARLVLLPPRQISTATRPQGPPLGAHAPPRSL